MSDRKSMDDIREALFKGEGNKLSKKEYKFAVILEKQRLFGQLVFLTFISFVVGAILFISLYFDISGKLIEDSSTQWSTTLPYVSQSSPI